MNSPLITLHEDPTEAYHHRSPRYAGSDVPAYLNEEGTGRPIPEDLPDAGHNEVDPAAPWAPPERERGEHGDEVSDDVLGGPEAPVHGQPAEEGGKVDEKTAATQGEVWHPGD